MSREVRMVPPGWKHPTDAQGHFIPLYARKFPDGTATHLMMYETCSEGTPISPAFATPEELAHWLADNNASAMGSQGASYESWLRVAQDGYAPSMVMVGGNLMSGVEFVGHQHDKEA